MLGILVLGVLAGGLFCWKSKQTPPNVTAQAITAAPVSAAPPAPPPPQFAPPPPPPIEELDAGPAPTAKGTSAAGTAGPAVNTLCSRCTDGNTSPALNSALRARGASVQGCYNRALQKNSDVSGSMTVSVQVGSNGSVCSASIVNDSVHSPDVSTCVLGRFRGQSFPPPTSGCVTLNIPIAFAVKQ